MDVDDVIDISDNEEDYTSRRAILEPPIRSVVDALGGYEDGRYRLGDECYGCLKDLKKFWRQDDTDDDRTVARIFWATRVLPNDLVPILLETAGKGMYEDKRAIAVADLMTAMTWPIDLAEELKELDEVMDKGADYTQLLQSHLQYKAALLRPGVMEALLGIVLPCLAKDAKERTERDVQIIGVILYLIRNLAAIKDLPANAYSSADQAELATLQSKLVKILSDTNILDLLLTIASNAGDDPMFNNWNTLVLEIFYLLFRGIRPTSLVSDQAKQPAENLRRLLAVEDKLKRDFSRNSSTRHSRFGTTIAVSLNPKHAKAADAPAEPHAEASTSSQAFVLHRQQAIKRDAGAMLDMTAGKKSKAQKVKKVDALGREESMSLESRLVLQNLAKTFIESCFNPFLASILKDIRAERPKIIEKDHLRLLFLTKWFMEFYLCLRNTDKSRTWDFGLVAEVTERGWIIWVLRRMREAVNEKPKLWTELQAGVECLTQLILLIDCMSASGEESVATIAEILQTQIVYNGEVLDIAFDSLKVYKEGTQSLAYLDSSVHLAYALLKLLEKCSTGAYVRQKKRKARRKKKADESTVPDVEEEVEEEPEDITETTFSYDSFEQRFANPDVTQTLLMYLARYKEFHSSENMKRVVNLLHRQAVKAKAEGLFFKVSTLELFKNIIADEKQLPKEQPYKDLIALIHFILRQFFKAVEEDNFLIIEAFFPKNRGKWKALSSWEPPAKPLKPEDDDMLENRWPAEVRVKKGYSWSQELGIAIKILVEEEKMTLIDWIKQILTIVIAKRKKIIEDTDGSSSNVIDVDDPEEHPAAGARKPSDEALEKITDYMIPYVNDEQANAATKDPHVKLVFRLLKFAILEEDSDELEWFVPAALLPEELQRYLNVINQFLAEPIDLNGESAASQLKRKPRKRRRRRHSPTPPGSDAEDDAENPLRTKRKAKKKKETKQYKSAQFIEDSDIEEDALQAFFEKEKALREKMALQSAASGKLATMKASGTKKRRKNGKEGARKRKRAAEGEAVEREENEAESGEERPTAAVDVDAVMDKQDSDAESDVFDPFASPKPGPSSTSRTSPSDDEVEVVKPKPKPRPRPRAKAPPTTEELQSAPSEPPESPRPSSSPGPPINVSSDDDEPIVPRKIVRKKLFLSDDEED